MSNTIKETTEARGERKYWNYADNWNRLTSAMENKDYVGVISLCSALMEDRLISILNVTFRSYKKTSLGTKVEDVRKIAKKDEMLSKYLSDEFWKELKYWVPKRNKVIHDIADVKIKTTELREIAENGAKYVQKLQSISRQYKKAKMTDEDKQAIKERPYFKLHKHKEDVHRKFTFKANDELELFIGDNKILHIKIVDNIIHWKETIDNEIVKKTKIVDDSPISKLQYHIKHFKYEENVSRKFVLKYNDIVELFANEKCVLYIERIGDYIYWNETSSDKVFKTEQLVKE